jgi:DNA-binding HxlR family transcriptional regulator
MRSGGEGDTQGEDHTGTLSIAGVLRLIGDGAGGQILMALGDGPLRTGQLAERIEHFSARSVYRYASKMHECGLIDRFEKPGIPSTVILSLSNPLGRDLCDLLRGFAGTRSARLPCEGRDFQSWASLSLLAELWELGFIEELSYESRALTELASSVPEMTYHQVNRRIGMFISNGLLTHASNGVRKQYELTEHGRRRMAFIAAIGRWRERHLGTGAPGLTVKDMTTLLRAALPLAVLPEFAGMRIDLGVSDPVSMDGHRDARALRGVVEEDGPVRCVPRDEEPADGSAAGTINTWLRVLLDGNRGRVAVRGELGLVDACLTQLHEVLWEQDRVPV